MNVLIDGDGCPVIEIAVRLCRKFNIPCTIFCDTAHEIHRDGAQTITIDKGADNVDFAIANRVVYGDLVITQDYGLASMALGRGCRVLHQDGWEYTEWNIGALLLQRHEMKKFRAAGGHQKSIPKRTGAQNAAFEAALASILAC